MVYDPNNPITPPPGGFAVTSVPPIPGGGGMPQRNPGAPVAPVPGANMPPRQAPPPGGFGNLPPGGGNFGGGFIPGGGLTPGGMPPIPGREGSSVLPIPGGFGGGGERGQFNREALQSFIEQFRNNLFNWLSTRPQDGGDMQAWLGQKPQLDMTALRTAMFSPSTPAPAPAPVPGVPPAI